MDDKFRDLTEADVAAALDWKRRVELMRNHLGLLGVVMPRSPARACGARYAAERRP